jgi:hypothetical protein
MMRWIGHIAWMRENWNIISGKVRRKETTRKIKMLADNIKMDLEEVGWGAMD